MSDLIDRQEAIDALNSIVRTDNWKAAASVTLLELPSVQPVIRCKDCKNFGGGTYCYERDGMWDENDFCSYAERRGEEDEDE